MILSGLGKMSPSFKCFVRARVFVLALSLNPICMLIAAEVNGAQIASLSPDQQDLAEIIWIPDNSVVILLSAILGLLLFLILSSFGLFFLLHRDLKTLQKDPR